MNINRRDMFVTPVWEVDTGFDRAFNLNLLTELNQYYQGGAGSPLCHTIGVATL